jgi:hypothetical protein
MSFVRRREGVRFDLNTTVEIRKTITSQYSKLKSDLTPFIPLYHNWIAQYKSMFVRRSRLLLCSNCPSRVDDGRIPPNCKRNSWSQRSLVAAYCRKIYPYGPLVDDDDLT